ncbi:hypothetical protein ACVW1C_002054 [Bradyrhizobium sp. USDA 4011]
MAKQRPGRSRRAFVGAAITGLPAISKDGWCKAFAAVD